MRNLLLKAWARFKAPFVFVGLALAALALVVAEAFRRGERHADLKEVKEHEKDELEKIDRMAAAGDARALHDDILKRVRDGHKRE